MNEKESADSVFPWSSDLWKHDDPHFGWEEGDFLRRCLCALA